MEPVSFSRNWPLLTSRLRTVPPREALHELLSKNSAGFSVVHAALRWSCPPSVVAEMLKVARKAGPTGVEELLSVRTKAGGLTPLHIAASYSNDVASTSLLVAAHPPSLLFLSRDRQTPLETVELLSTTDVKPAVMLLLKEGTARLRASLDRRALDFCLKSAARRAKKSPAAAALQYSPLSAEARTVLNALGGGSALGEGARALIMAFVR